MKILPLLLLVACGYNSRFELLYTGELRGALVVRETGPDWSSMQITPADMVDFEALAEGMGEDELSWSSDEGLKPGEVVTAEAWIDTEGALADGCPDLLDFTICRAGPNDPQASESREPGPVSFNTWRLVLEDPE